MATGFYQQDSDEISRAAARLKELDESWGKHILDGKSWREGEVKKEEGKGSPIAGSLLNVQAKELLIR